MGDSFGKYSVYSFSNFTLEFYLMSNKELIGLMILSTLILIGLALYLMLMTMWMAILTY